MITDTLEIELFMLGVLILILVAVVLYMIAMMGRVEMTLHRVQRMMQPGVPRDMNGKRLHIR